MIHLFLCVMTLLGAAGASQSQAVSQQPKDPLAPKTSAASATIGPLRAVTLATSDLAQTLRLYRDGLGMRVRGPVELSGAVQATQHALWGVPTTERWTLYLLDRPSVPEAIQIRLLVFDRPGPTIRGSWNPLEPGPFTLGFPTTDLPRIDAALRTLGFSSLAPMERGSIKRPDGSSYGMLETIFKGPDRVHAVLVSRLDGMPQLGPVDPATGLGGPAYSAQVVVDSDAVLKFYCDVLGLELRSDREWVSGPTSALGVAAGTPFRLAIVYAPGATSGHLLLMDFRDRTAPASGVAPRPPHRGLGMYSFPVKNLDQTLARVRAAGVPVIGGPVAYESPDLGAHRAATLAAPTGVLVELFERLPAGRRAP